MVATHRIEFEGFVERFPKSAKAGEIPADGWAEIKEIRPYEDMVEIRKAGWSEGGDIFNPALAADRRVHVSIVGWSLGDAVSLVGRPGVFGEWLSGEIEGYYEEFDREAAEGEASASVSPNGSGQTEASATPQSSSIT